jgi:hypothetical protein
MEARVEEAREIGVYMSVERRQGPRKTGAQLIHTKHESCRAVPLPLY